MLRTILIIVAIVVVLGILAGAVVYWYTSQRPADTDPQGVTEIPIQGDAIPEATGIEPELGELSGETGRTLEAPAGEADTLGQLSPETGSSPGDIETVDLADSPTTGDLGQPETVATVPPRVTRPAENTGSRPTAGTQPELTIIAEATPTPQSATGTTQPVVTTAPPATQAPTTTTPRPTPAPGSYSVRTIQPVPEARLTEVRKVMAALNVTLQEQKTGQSAIQAQRLSLGYFRAKSEAESWAASNLKPNGVSYFVYPIQNMYSIQIGVYAEQQNVDRAQRSLYEKFPGWRLPLRVEPLTVNKAAYILSISNIHPDLADNIWRKLNQIGIQAEIHG